MKKIVEKIERLIGALNKCIYTIDGEAKGGRILRGSVGALLEALNALKDLLGKGFFGIGLLRVVNNEELENLVSTFRIGYQQFLYQCSILFNLTLTVDNQDISTLLNLLDTHLWPLVLEAQKNNLLNKDQVLMDILSKQLLNFHIMLIVREFNRAHATQIAARNLLLLGLRTVNAALENLQDATVPDEIKQLLQEVRQSIKNVVGEKRRTMTVAVKTLLQEYEGIYLENDIAKELKILNQLLTRHNNLNEAPISEEFSEILARDLCHEYRIASMTKSLVSVSLIKFKKNVNELKKNIAGWFLHVDIEIANTIVELNYSIYFLSELEEMIDKVFNGSSLAIDSFKVFALRQAVEYFASQINKIYEAHVNHPAIKKFFVASFGENVMKGLNDKFLQPWRSQFPDYERDNDSDYQRRLSC